MARTMAMNFAKLTVVLRFLYRRRFISDDLLEVLILFRDRASRDRPFHVGSRLFWEIITRFLENMYKICLKYNRTFQ